MTGDDADHAHGSEVTVLVDEAIYSRQCILNACYWFSDRYDFSLARTDAGSVEVRIRSKPGRTLPDSVARDFENALIDHQLRLDIRRETAPIRALIVAKAFAEGELLTDAPTGDDRVPVERAGDEPKPRKSA
jgi:His-Xaa-Ser system protein HxsD